MYSNQLVNFTPVFPGNMDRKFGFGGPHPGFGGGKPHPGFGGRPRPGFGWGFGIGSLPAFGIGLGLGLLAPRPSPYNPYVFSSTPFSYGFSPYGPYPNY